MDESQTNAISAAVQTRRHKIVNKLVELNIDVSIEDADGRTPLLHAVANGDTDTVKCLLAAGARYDDGSLHEAARLCYPSIVETLISHRHDVNFRSLLYGGRTALGELCLLAKLESKQAESQADKTMKALIEAGTNFESRVNGKTVLHLAMTNDRPVEVTRILLRFPEVWKDINTDSEVFLYEDANNICMSPDRFITERCTCRNNDKVELQTLLKQKGCKSKWYRKRGTQVPNPEGLPPALEEIQRQNEEMQRQEDLEEQRQQRSIARANTRAAADRENRAEMRRQEMALDKAAVSQRRSHANLERQDEQSHKSAMAQIEYSTIKDQNQLKLTAMERESELEKRMIGSRDNADRTAHTRAMSQLEMRQKTIKLAGSEQRRTIEAAKAARIDSTQLMLQNVD